jgi:hypothetical protein
MELATPNGDQCAACASPLAPDQRYCLNCGERRGAARLPATDARAKPAPAERPRRRRRRPGTTTGTALIAGIATLLLAMGVGVLIGHQGKGSTAKAAPAAVQVVTVPGADAAAATPTTTAQPAASAATRHTGKAKHHKSSHAVKSSKAPAKAPPPSTVQVGTPGHGKGYKNGKFTGDFFGQ